MRLVTTAAVLALAGAASAQTDILYTMGNNGWNSAGNNYRIQGGAMIGQWANEAGQTQHSALAVINTIRSGGRGATGYEYDLNGTYTGQTLGGQFNYYDGTTDGVRYNYAINYSGEMYRTDLFWNNAEFIWNAPGNAIGVAYDAVNGTLWTNGFDNTIRQHNIADGSIISQFGHNSALASLAWEPSTDTLWTGAASNQIWQYDKAGNFMQSLTIQGITGMSGMEFAIPAPASAALLGLAGLTASRRRR